MLSQLSKKVFISLIDSFCMLVQEFKTKEEFLNAIRKAKYVIIYAKTSLPVWHEFVCSVGDLNLTQLKYKNYSVIVVNDYIADVFKLWWTRRPEIKYYVIDQLNEGDKRGAVIPLKSNEEGEKILKGIQ